MKYYELKLAAAIFCIVAFFAVLGVVGEYDWAEHVVLRMLYEEYGWVKDTLRQKNGQEPTQNEIARWWTEHHSDYKE